MKAAGLARRLGRRLRRLLGGAPPRPDKYDREVRFWRGELDHLVSWYAGEIAVHYRTSAPRPEQRVVRADTRHSAILTWFELHQKPKYLHDLRLPADAFRGLRVLDVGAGPMPSGEAFAECDLYCLDPLLPRYLEAGWPLHLYGPRTRFVHGHGERMPLDDDSFDAVISVNAIDHVDDLAATAAEIGRVLAPGGRLALHVHYHPPTAAEPLELDDDALRTAFAWCPGFVKVAESTEKSSAVARPGEAYALWSNVHSGAPR